MYQVGDRFVYGVHGICRITALEERTVDRKKILYYVLESKAQPGAYFYVPTHNQAAVAKLRRLLSRQELDELLSSDAVRQEVWVSDENKRKQVYRELIGSGDRCRLISMVSSLYRHKQEQAAAGRKFHLCDENFLRDAEKLLSSEFSEVLEIPRDQVGAYIRRTLHIDM